MDNLLAERQAISLVVGYEDSVLLHSLETEDFSDSSLADILLIAKSIYSEDGVCDFIRVTNAMKLKNKDTNPLVAIIEVGVPSPSIGASILKALRECRAIRECASFNPNNFTPTELPSAMISHGMEMAKLLEFGVSDAEGIKEKIRNKPPRIPTGIQGMDKMLGGGVTETSLCVIAARSGTGKSYMAAKIAAHSLQDGKTVHFTSLEMDETQIHMRVLKSIHEVTDAEVIESLDNAWVYDDRLITQCRKGRLNEVLADMHKHSSADIFIVDYLGLISDPTEKNNVIELGNIARSLKLFAMFHKKPVFCLHQINRDSVRAGKRPHCHDLRGSGQIEEHADEVTFLWKDEPSEGQSYKDLAAEKATNDHFGIDEDPFAQKMMWIVDKNRHGMVGEIEVDFDPRIGFIS